MNDLISTETNVTLSGLIDYNETSLKFTRKPTWDEAEVAVHTLDRMQKSINYWLGDAANYFEHCFGDDYVQLFDTDYTAQSIRVFKWVCKSIPPNRRRKELTMGHHAAVAGVEDEAEQEKLLNISVKEHLTVNELRKAVKGESKPKKEKLIQTNCPNCNHAFDVNSQGEVVED